MGALFWLWTLAGLICGLLPYLPFSPSSGVLIGIIAGLLHEQSAQTRKTVDGLMAQLVRLGNTVNNQTEELQRLSKLLKHGGAAKHTATSSAGASRTDDLEELPDAVRHLWREDSTTEPRQDTVKEPPVVSQTAAAPVTPAAVTVSPLTPADISASSGAAKTTAAPATPEAPPAQQAARATPVMAKVTQEPAPALTPAPTATAPARPRPPAAATVHSGTQHPANTGTETRGASDSTGTGERQRPAAHDRTRAARRDSHTPRPVSVRYEEPENWLLNTIKDWFFSGNTLVRAGLVLLFIGLAFLAKYAIDQNRLPPEFRLIGIAATGLVLSVLGWRLRHKRPGYALSLQGGGMAIMYLTVYAALRLYTLLSPGATLLLMLILVIAMVGLAVAQDAAALAILAVAGGFAAPILTSSDTGNHVQLFSYYALLNAGIVILAWKKSWRALNLTGFIFTFVIGGVWGYQNYTPAYFSSTEPFLILFCLMYVAAAVLYALRAAPNLRDPVDGTLVFGVPAAATLLQATLVYGMPYRLAWSAGIAGMFYLALAWLMRRYQRNAWQLLIQCFNILGIAFLTMAVPLALDNQLSAAVWALEGAALWWLGIRQQRLFPAISGALLQLGTGVLFARTMAGGGAAVSALPFLNVTFISCLIIAASAIASAWIFSRADKNNPVRNILHSADTLLLLWALFWWLGGGLYNIVTFVSPDTRFAAALLFSAVTALLSCRITDKQDWPLLLPFTILPLPVMLIVLLARHMLLSIAPDSNGGWLAWPFAGFAYLYSLYLAEKRNSFDRNTLTALHSINVLLLAGLLSTEFGIRLSGILPLSLGSGAAPQHNAFGGIWIGSAYLLPIAFITTILTRLIRNNTFWPFGVWRRAYGFYGLLPLIGIMLVYLFIAPGLDPGDSTLLPYIPLLNPFDLLSAFILYAIILWLVKVGEAEHYLEAEQIKAAWIIIFAIGFYTLNAVIFRAVHQLFEIPYNLADLWSSGITQAAMSLLWTLSSLILMLYATKSEKRSLWLMGAGGLGLVIAKLFLIDMAASNTLERIIAFIGCGVFLLIIGYFSPLPPARKEKEHD